MKYIEIFDNTDTQMKLEDAFIHVVFILSIFV